MTELPSCPNLNTIPGCGDDSVRWLAEPILGFHFRSEDSHLPPRHGPCIVVRSQSCREFSDQALCKVISAWTSADDVLYPSFYQNIFLVRDSGEEGVQPERLEDFPSLQAIGTVSITQMVVGNDMHGVEKLSSGPYFWTGSHFHRVYWTYADTQSAFFSSIIQSPMDGRFLETRPTTHVAVPSRIYSLPKTHQSPLSGLRFAVKDVIDVAGLKTSAGSRAYYKLVPASATSALLVTHFIALGAVLVGKTKNTQFANGEDPQEWIDYTCPWNPRGDAYQNPDTSSSGSATAVSSYDWIDFTIGSDTCGSIACPAAAQGVFAIRFSTGAASHEGIFKINKYLDSVGFFTRNVDTLSEITSLWLKPDDRLYRNIPESWVPTDVVYPWSSFSHENKETLEALENLVNSLVKFTGASRTDLDLDSEWKHFDPLRSASSIYEDLKKTTGYLHLAGFSDTVEPFRIKFKEHFGREPYIDRVNRAKLETAARDVTPAIRRETLQQVDAFSQFIRAKVVPGALDTPGSGRSIMVWPFNPMEPQYRDNYPPESAHVNWRWNVDYTAPLAGLPQVIIPSAYIINLNQARFIINPSDEVGQYRYESRITGTTDYLPICACIVGPREGSDVSLTRFISRFCHESGAWPVSVNNGRYI